jgi:hypothetical protein
VRRLPENESDFVTNGVSYALLTRWLQTHGRFETNGYQRRPQADGNQRRWFRQHGVGCRLTAGLRLTDANG